MKNLLKKLPVRDLLIILQAVVILTLLHKCNNSISKEEQDLKLAQYLKTEQSYKTIINEFGQEISSQKQVLINKDRQMEKVLLENTTLKRLNSQIKFETTTTLEEVTAIYKEAKYLTEKLRQISILPNGDTVYINKVDTIGLSFGTKFSKSDKWFSFSGSVEKQGIEMDSLSIYNSYVVTIGTKRKSLFKPNETYVELFNENPYTRTNSLNNVKVIEKKKWYQKSIVKLGAGFILGATTIFLLK